MANFIVNQTTDDGTGLTEGTLSYAILSANQLAGDDTITIDSDVRFTGVVKTLVNSNITIVGNNHTISGDANNNGINDNGDVRPLFIKSGIVSISGLTITNGRAKGGDTTVGGGGGAGMGGGLFIYDGSVSLTDVVFSNNAAQGGNGSIGRNSGGGGMFGNSSGFGGGGLFASNNGDNGGYGGNGNYGGFGGVGVSNGNGIGGFGGFGGGGGRGDGGRGGPGVGGFGGFGGGGGFADIRGGNGGFGGGGGAGSFGGGLGGYGGGGGGGGSGDGGFGGGRGGEYGGGGGAGMGGGIFVRSGSLTLNNTSFTNNTATGGTGGPSANSGQGLGGAIFIMQSVTNTISNLNSEPLLPTFSGNSAANDAGTPTNNDDVYGIINSLSITALTAIANEGGSNGVFRLTRVNTNGNLIVNLTIDGSSTASTADYSLSGGNVTVSGSNLTVTFTAGQSFVDIDLAAIDDIATEADETLKLNLATGTGYTINSANNTATVTIAANDEVQNSPPTAVDDNATTNEDTAISGNVLANDTDPDTGDTLTVSAVNGNTANVGTEIALTSGALLTQNANGSFDYNPNGQFESLAVGATASDSFNYTISDGNGGTDTATVTITINGVNDAPTVANIIADQTTLEDGFFSFTVPANTFADVDAGDSLTYSATLANGNPLPAWLTFNANTRTFSGTPDDPNNGTISIKVTATDTSNASANDTFNLTVTPVNDAPVAGDDSASANQNTPLTLLSADLLANDTDVDSSTLSITAVSNGVNGTVSLNGSGNVVFTPTTGFSGNGSFNYTVSDGNGGTNLGMVTVAVGVNLNGTNNNDNLNGTSGNDIINGLNAQDTISGNAGNDCLVGSNGDDLLFSGTGNDQLYGGNGQDTLYGDAGNDYLEGDNGDDKLYAGDGNDSLIGGNGQDLLVSGAGNDFLNGGKGDDNLTGGAGSDIFVLDKAAGRETITDFSLGQSDLIGLSGLSYSQLSFSGNQISLGNQTLAVLTGFNTTTLTQNNFISV
ncbi:MAG: Ig-like domain-containing protein [Nostoc sp. DedQUE12a]|nr:Ig-like domain-containing protein [Nostoc sp. DedQUE12a]